MKQALLLGLLVFTCFVISACASSDSGEQKEQRGTNALREYVNTPKDKARAASRKVARKQRQVDEQAASLVDD